MKLTKTKNHAFAGILAFGLLMGLSVFWVNKDNLSTAADARNFNASNIMSDFVMTNKHSMTEAEIQTFLESKNPCNNRNIGLAAQYPSYQYNIKNGKFVCLAEENFNGESAARIIWQAGQDYNINPQVLIVLLQKEQGLITDTWPNHIQYRSATGYGCPDTADCDGKYYGFKNQVRNAANFFRAYQTGNTGWFKLVWQGNKYTGTWEPFSYNMQLHPNAGCGTVSTHIENRATASLYSYTPYRPNQAALNAQYGTGDGCSSYGNRNFWLYFSDWFGSTQGTIYKDVDYAPVFNAEYYLNKYSDLRTAFGDDQVAAFNHFIQHGIREGRQATEDFDLISYRNQNPDLRRSFGSDNASYYRHYSTTGHKQDRISSGDRSMVYTTSHGGKDYSLVYDFEVYIKNHWDLRAKFSNDDQEALAHFITFGMREGRVASDTFNVTSYRNMYPDLRRAFGSNLKDYYLHYISNGKREGRVATGDTLVGTSVRGGVNYSLVYNFNTYSSKYSDIKRTFGVDDEAALSHFTTFGMREGRIASDTFDVHKYRSNYPDLQRAFGSNLQSYYTHYINYGHKEKRVAI